MYKYVSVFAIVSIGAAAGAIIVDEQKPPVADKTYQAHTTEPVASPKTTAISADPSGHFQVAALVNGTHVSMLADTGATLVVLTDEDAVRAGLDPRKLAFNAPVQTANGRTMTARVKLDEVRVGGIILRNVDALVAQPMDLQKSLLGMSFIGRLQSFQLKGDQLVLNQ